MMHGCSSDVHLSYVPGTRALGRRPAHRLSRSTIVSGATIHAAPAAPW